jgi:hypothetical protein
MHLTALAAMTYNIEALAAERMKGVSDTNLLWKFMKNVRCLECVGRTRERPRKTHAS